MHMQHNKDENNADNERSDAVQNEMIYEEVHAYLSQGHYPLARSHKAGEMHNQKEIQELSVTGWCSESTTRKREVLCGR